jgi:hypothetical protein
MNFSSETDGVLRKQQLKAEKERFVKQRSVIAGTEKQKDERERLRRERNLPGAPRPNRRNASPEDLERI